MLKKLLEVMMVAVIVAGVAGRFPTSGGTANRCGPNSENDDI